MKNRLFLFFCLFLAEFLSAQVVNRYPYIQRPNQTSATIAWRRANAGIGTLFIGNSAGVWTDSLSTAGPEQKPYFDLAGLQPNTLYFYQCRTAAPNDFFLSAIDSFYTAPVSNTDRFSFLAYGDCGYNNTPQNAVKNLMQTEKADFAIVTGDVDQGVGRTWTRRIRRQAVRFVPIDGVTGGARRGRPRQGHQPAIRAHRFDGFDRGGNMAAEPRHHRYQGRTPVGTGPQ